MFDSTRKCVIFRNFEALTRVDAGLFSDSFGQCLKFNGKVTKREVAVDEYKLDCDFFDFFHC